MEKFAGYGFNKSHAAAYALVAYQTAYMKAHHAAAFMAANMSAVMADTDKVQQLFDDARAERAHDPAAGRQRERLPLRAARRRSRSATGWARSRARGEGAIGHIIDERARNGPFKDLFDFCHRVDKRVVNRRTVESLVRAGAFDSVNDHRASLLASVGIALESAEQASRARQPGEPLRRHGRAGLGGVARRRAALDRSRHAPAREERARLLPLGPPVAIRNRTK